MTAKPSPAGTQVGIQRWVFAERGDDGFPAVPSKGGYWVKHEDHIAVLNRVRSDLEALANKHRDDKRFRPIWAVRGDFVDELMALAATLGNQGK